MTLYGCITRSRALLLDLRQVFLQLSKAIVSELVEPSGLVENFAAPLLHSSLQVIDFGDDFFLHVIKLRLILFLCGLDLQHRVPVLLLDELKAVLQPHDLIHVVVLCHSVILLGQLFLIKLDKLGTTTLLKALKDIVAVPCCLRHR